MQLMLRHVYRRPLDEYNLCEAVNRDVLRLSEQFKLQGLYDLASQRIAMGLTTENVLRRLDVCKEFALASIREKASSS